MFLSFDIVGNCPAATEARQLAKLKRSVKYKQHSTIGLLRNTDFPEAVVRNYKEEWLECLSNQFITVQILTGRNISVRLPAEDEVTLWEVIFQCSHGTCKVFIKFTKCELKIVNTDSSSRELKSNWKNFPKLNLRRTYPSLFMFMSSSYLLNRTAQLSNWGKVLHLKLKTCHLLAKGFLLWTRIIIYVFVVKPE